MTEFKSPHTTLRSKDLAELTGATPRAIRHYLQLGLLEEPSRDSNGYRKFTAAHVVQVLRIKMLAESGASLKHILKILGSTGVPTTDDIDAIDQELTRKEALLRAQRSALKSLKDTQRASSQPSKTAQFDADISLMMSSSRQLSEETLSQIQMVLNAPEIQQRSDELMAKFEALEEVESIGEDAADFLAHEWAEFYSLISEQLQTAEPASDGPFVNLMEELRTQSFSPAQSTVWEKFLMLVENQHHPNN